MSYIKNTSEIFLSNTYRHNAIRTRLHQLTTAVLLSFTSKRYFSLRPGRSRHAFVAVGTCLVCPIRRCILKRYSFFRTARFRPAFVAVGTCLVCPVRR